jgi:hypothetical protein
MSYSEKHRQKLNRIGSFLLKPFIRVRHLRSDDSGNMMLLSGMMAFLFTIFALISSDTSQAIYNRIIAQNSVDAAADAAALWQARGCNMIQNLNNYHYEANQFFATTEATALNACPFAAVLRLASAFPGAAAAAQVMCVACGSAPIWDDAQNATAFAILKEQQWITTVTPYIALAAANDAAQGSGADELMTSASAWLNQSATSIGLPLPDLSGITSTLGNILGYLGITVYALPLDPKSLELGVNPVSKDLIKGSPWTFGPCSVDVVARKIAGCWGPDHPSSTLQQEEEQNSQNWGWKQDQYYVGHPGYMTWIAGKTSQPELAGLGFLKWLNPDATTPSENSNLPMYEGSSLSSSSLEIPAFIAFASSQVDGAPGTTWNGVGMDDEKPRSANAAPYLIPVYIPGIGAGTSVGIFH